MKFFGMATYKMSNKGRLSLPAKYRRFLPDEVVVCPSIDARFPSLELRSSDVFDAWVRAIEESREGVSPVSPQNQYVLRSIYAKSETLCIDEQGRICLPAQMRAFAQLTDGEVIVIGVGDHIEIWNPEIYKEAEAEYSAMDSKLIEE